MDPQRQAPNDTGQRSTKAAGAVNGSTTTVHREQAAARSTPHSIHHGDFFLRYVPLILEQRVSISRVELEEVRFLVDKERVVELVRNFPEREDDAQVLEDTTIIITDLTLKDYYRDVFGQRQPILYQIDGLSVQNLYARNPIIAKGDIRAAPKPQGTTP